MAIRLLAASALLSLVEVALALYGLNLAREASIGSLTQAQVDAFGGVASTVGWFLLIAFLATAVAFLAWLSRVVDNVPALGGGRPAASPRWAIAWWFIPFANLGMPYEVVRDVWLRLRAGGNQAHPRLLLGWWFAFLIGTAVDGATAYLPSKTVADATVVFSVAAIASALTACAGVLAILLVRTIESATEARAVEAQAPLPAPMPAPPEAPASGWRMRPSWVGFVAIPLASLIVLAGWVLGGGGSETSRISPSPSVAASASATTEPSAAAAWPATCPATGADGHPHQAPAIEAILPASVAGRDLTRWSVSGQCWLDLAFREAPDREAAFVAQVTTASNPHPINDTDLVYGIDGRSNLTTDPPYFVYAAVLPHNSDEALLAEALLLQGAGAKDLGVAADMTHYQAKTIGGKQVYVGTLDMLLQDTHQHGKPYLYQTDQYLFLILTDDDAWAADALGRLP